MRAATAFVRFRTPTACSIPHVPGVNAPAHTSRLRRFYAPDGSTRNLCPDFSKHPLLGFALRSVSLPLGPYLLSLSSRELYCRRAVTPARSLCPRAISWRVAIGLLRPPHSPLAFGLCSLWESVSRPRLLHHSRPAASLGFISLGISPFTPQTRLRGSSAPGLVPAALRPRRHRPSTVYRA